MKDCYPKIVLKRHCSEIIWAHDDERMPLHQANHKVYKLWNCRSSNDFVKLHESTDKLILTCHKICVTQYFHGQTGRQEASFYNLLTTRVVVLQPLRSAYFYSKNNLEGSIFTRLHFKKRLIAWAQVTLSNQNYDSPIYLQKNIKFYIKHENMWQIKI